MTPNHRSKNYNPPSLQKKPNKQKKNNNTWVNEENGRHQYQYQNNTRDIHVFILILVIHEKCRGTCNKKSCTLLWFITSLELTSSEVHEPLFSWWHTNNIRKGYITIYNFYELGTSMGRLFIRWLFTVAPIFLIYQNLSQNSNDKYR